MNLNKRFAELVGICWHEDVSNTDFPLECSCGDPGCEHSNPDYAADPRLVLEAMSVRDDWDEFLVEYGALGKHGRHFDMIPVDLIRDRTGHFRDLAIEWLEGRTP